MSHPLHSERIARLRDYLLELRAKVGHFSKGVAALAAQKYEDAVENFELFLGVFPDSHAARNNLAVALHQRALLAAKAGPVYRRSTDVDPDARVRPIKLRSTEEERRTARIDQRLLREAIAEYTLVLSQAPDYAPAHNNLGTAYSDLGRIGEAKKHLERALALRPQYKEALNNLAVVRALGRDVRRASAHLQAAIKLDPKYAPAYFNLALLQERAKEAPERGAARATWKRYLELDPASGWSAVAKAHQQELERK